MKSLITNMRNNKDKRKLKTEPKFQVDLNEEQKRAKTLFYEYDVNFIHGDYGAGKTLLACEIALSSFRKKQFNKIVITRPVVRNELGFLPGDVGAKMEPLVAPIVHNFNMLQNPSMTEKMMADKSIEILPVSYSKGITFVESVIIVDEYEDLTYSDFRMLLTRLGKDSKIIFCGSKEQVDRKIGGYSCMHETLKLKDSGIVGFSTLKSNHRNQAIYEVLDFLEGTDTEKEEEYEECKNSES